MSTEINWDRQGVEGREKEFWGQHTAAQEATNTNYKSTPNLDVRNFFFNKRVANSWNKLPEKIATQAPPLLCFKQKLSTYISSIDFFFRKMKFCSCYMCIFESMSIYSLSNFEIRRYVTRARLCIPGELPSNVRVVYGIAAKHAHCMVTHLTYAIYREWHHIKSQRWSKSSIYPPKQTRYPHPSQSKHCPIQKRWKQLTTTKQNIKAIILNHASTIDTIYQKHLYRQNKNI